MSLVLYKHGDNSCNHHVGEEGLWLSAIRYPRVGQSNWNHLIVSFYLSFISTLVLVFSLFMSSHP